MTDTPAHTPLPWASQPLETGDDVGVSIVGSNLGGLVCASLPWPTEIDSGDYSRVEANAAFIVRACNSHYQLVSALESANTLLTKAVGDIVAYRIMAGKRSSKSATAEYVEAINAIDAALSQAGGAGE